MKTKNLFITGKPASGKTTLIKEVCLPYMDKTGGFYTEEIIQNNARLGFLLKTFDGRQGVLAKKGMKSPHKLNKYGIDINVLENIGADALVKAVKDKELIVIDEIGTMELVSDIFRVSMQECFGSNKRVLATVRFNAQPFTDEIKKMRDTSVLTLTRDNFAEIKKQVKEWLLDTI
jgi:nucleoside-triphosphatase